MQHLLLVILYEWLSGMQVGMNNKYQVLYNTVVSPDDGQIVARNM